MKALTEALKNNKVFSRRQQACCASNSRGQWTRKSRSVACFIDELMWIRSLLTWMMFWPNCSLTTWQSHGYQRWDFKDRSSHLMSYLNISSGTCWSKRMLVTSSSLPRWDPWQRRFAENVEETSKVSGKRIVVSTECHIQVLFAFNLNLHFNLNDYQ